MLIVIYLYGFTFFGFIAGLGFLFATIGKLQKEILQMKIFLFLSTITWLFFMINFGFISFIIFYSVGTIVLIWEIKKLLSKERLKT